MMGVQMQDQMEKMKTAVREAVAYADKIAADEKLRADLRSAIGHGAEAGDRIKKELDAGGLSSRLAHDRKLRKKLRAMLDDLDSASDRIRRRKRHRLRNVLAVLGGVAVVAALVPTMRAWFSRTDDASTEGDVEPTL